MIFRRIAAHLRKQEWAAIAIDFVIVVVGVFVGLQAQAWNESREDRARERMYIERLTRDFTAVEARTVASSARWQLVVDASRRLIADVDAFNATGKAQRTQQELIADINAVHGTRIPAPQAATFVELLSTGEIRVLRNDALRDALLDYDTQAHFSLVAYEVLVARSREATIAIATHAEVNLPEVIENLPENPNPQIYRSIDFTAFARDPVSRNALKMLGLAAANQGGLSIAQRDNARRVLEMLEGAR